MMKKQLADDLASALVTFSVPSDFAGDRIAVVGEFNGWNPEANVLQPNGNGACTCTVALELGRHYRFRYLVDGERWENDWEADYYEPNEFGGNDSVVRTDDLSE
jgi:1,4-alpha-glucan branching enzyme